jgi:enoyl-CoA hydratase/carnithine racemase
MAGDPDIRALVVTGEGESFCSGADLSWLDQGASQDVTPYKLRERMLPFYKAWLMPRDLPFPVIGAINGPAIGAGMCITLACDLRYASHTASFSAPFIYLGTHGGMAVTSLLPEAIGVSRAREMLYTGRTVGAQEALQWGLVSDVVDDVLAHSVYIGIKIASAAPIPTRLTKAGLERSSDGVTASLQWEALAQPLTLATADLHEGIQARREHREPNFHGA